MTDLLDATTHANSTRARTPELPQARGPLSGWLLQRLTEAGHRSPAPTTAGRPGLGEDVQLSLYLCYELHYGPLSGVPADLEWEPEILEFRRALESRFEAALRSRVAPTRIDRPIELLIPALIAADDGPSLSTYMETVGTIDQMREVAIHRSAYQLKEADPHTFAIPRLHGRAKQLLAEIQAGEYGADEPDRLMHSQLFAQTMRGLGLDDRPNGYLDRIPASGLAISNLISLFGLHRRWRGALVGHLAVFELTSVTPMGRYSRGLERMGADRQTRRFYDVHVLADAVHEVLALDMAAALVAEEPELLADVVFGAQCVLATERVFAEELLRRFDSAQRDRVSSAA